MSDFIEGYPKFPTLLFGFRDITVMFFIILKLPILVELSL